MSSNLYDTALYHERVGLAHDFKHLILQIADRDLSNHRTKINRFAKFLYPDRLWDMEGNLKQDAFILDTINKVFSEGLKCPYGEIISYINNKDLFTKELIVEFSYHTKPPKSFSWIKYAGEGNMVNETTSRIYNMLDKEAPTENIEIDLRTKR